MVEVEAGEARHLLGADAASHTAPDEQLVARSEVLDVLAVGNGLEYLAGDDLGVAPRQVIGRLGARRLGEGREIPERIELS